MRMPLTKRRSALGLGILLFGLLHPPLTWARPPFPDTPRIPVRDTLHGVVLVDDYRWLEGGSDPRVIAWTAAQNAAARAILDTLPQRAELVRRFNQLQRQDDRGVPSRAIEGTRRFFWAKRAAQEKWTYQTRADAGAPAEVVLDPNLWAAEVTLSSPRPSRSGRYVAYGRARGGDESPVVCVRDLRTGRELPDSLRGWKQYVESWLPDDAGFFYTAKPTPGLRAPGEEHYWHAVYLHRLGTPAAADQRVFWHSQVKEYYHGAEVSEDGACVAFYRWNFSRNELYLQRLDRMETPIPLATGFDGAYQARFAGDKILIRTDARSPYGELYIADRSAPQRTAWRLLVPAEEGMRLSAVTPIAGHLYLTYQKNAHSLIRIYDLQGRHLRDLPLPMLGSARVSGRWSQPEVWVQFSSFTYPSTIFRYEFARDRLELFHAFPLEVDVESFTTEQVWYESRDGTQVPMFLVHRGDLVRDGRTPALLTGYGGFDASMRPYFSTRYLVWLQSGGMLAIPNLRGGGEFGRAWHEAGMRERKQNVFDDFLAAAEWLIEERYTSAERLAIKGGSNGGLLVGAASIQRPGLFRVVWCQVPLLDMLRYHRFGLANIWAEEYGSADDPEQFTYLRAYSPYHNVVDGADYPIMLFTGSENDARVDPFHVRKMVARLQASGAAPGTILMQIYAGSGHGGGTTLATKIEQSADGWALLMHALGMQVAE
ncbi:MAG: prolyl oligopeptidase family serine peptidase [Candidatus Eisenbacteria bacterium]|nr:prolyl oligopeptidase family serine peptidase [Candidatus Eisenbacteria bacterium]